MSATTDTVKGRAKEAVGVVTNDQELKDEGRVDEVVGKVKKTVEQVIDKAKDVEGTSNGGIGTEPRAVKPRSGEGDVWQVEACTFSCGSHDGRRRIVVRRLQHRDSAGVAPPTSPAIGPTDPQPLPAASLHRPHVRKVIREQ
jgi:uncharacterized protein YjbJ (UPF0337 family)